MKRIWEGVDRIQFRIIFSGGSYEYGNETSGSLKGGECQMFKKKKTAP
jgi:hypothetical protein